MSLCLRLYVGLEGGVTLQPKPSKCRSRLKPMAWSWLGGSTDCQKPPSLCLEAACISHLPAFHLAPLRAGCDHSLADTPRISLQTIFKWDSIYKGNSCLMVVEQRQPNHLSTELTHLQGRENKILSPRLLFSRGLLRAS